MGIMKAIRTNEKDFCRWKCNETESFPECIPVSEIIHSLANYAEAEEGLSYTDEISFNGTQPLSITVDGLPFNGFEAFIDVEAGTIVINCAIPVKDEGADVIISVANCGGTPVQFTYSITVPGLNPQ